MKKMSVVLLLYLVVTCSAVDIYDVKTADKISSETLIGRISVAHMIFLEYSSDNDILLKMRGTGEVDVRIFDETTVRFISGLIKRTHTDNAVFLSSAVEKRHENILERYVNRAGVDSSVERLIDDHGPLMQKLYSEVRSLGIPVHAIDINNNIYSKIWKSGVRVLNRMERMSLPELTPLSRDHELFIWNYLGDESCSFFEFENRMAAFSARFECMANYINDRLRGDGSDQAYCLVPYIHILRRDGLRDAVMKRGPYVPISIVFRDKTGNFRKVLEGSEADYIIFF